MTTRLSLFFAAASLLVATPALAASPCDGFAETMMDKATTVFHNTGMDEAAKRKELAGLFAGGVDTDWIGRYVLGRYWKAATPDQQVQYLKLYRSYLTNSYIAKFKDADGLNVDKITINSFAPAADAGEYDVKTLIKFKDNNDPEVKVDYRLAEVSGACKAHDIKVEGISLLISQRSEFGNLAASSGVDGVINALKTKAPTALQ